MTLDVNQDQPISYLMKDGEPTLVSLGDRHSGRKEDKLDRQLVYTIQPSRFTTQFIANSVECMKNRTKYLCIKNAQVFPRLLGCNTSYVFMI